MALYSASVRFLLVLVLILPGATYGHEGGHDVPGALPPAPNGGRVEEAHHKVEHSEHEEEKEDEFFFEALYKDKTLKIFPLYLRAKDPLVFQPAALQEITRMTVRVENPRTSKSEEIVVQTSGDGFAGKFDPLKANRFIVHVSAFHKNELKEAAIQLERE